MTGLKKSWDTYKNEFLKKDVKIEEIEIFLKDTYSKELRKYNIEGIGIPYNRWKYRTWRQSHVELVRLSD